MLLANKKGTLYRDRYCDIALLTNHLLLYSIQGAQNEGGVNTLDRTWEKHFHRPIICL